MEYDFVAAVSEPRVFVVANPELAGQVAGWLEASGLVGVTVAYGDAGTLGQFRAAPPDVVVLAASLASGDALALASALRAEGQSVPLVLIGEAQGPVRTALDAVEFAADRFLRWPVSPNALTFAVRSLASPTASRAGAMSRKPLLSAHLHVPRGTVAGSLAARLIDDRLESAAADAAALLFDELVAAAPIVTAAPVMTAASVTASSPPSLGNAPDDASFGTELRRTMSDIESRPFATTSQSHLALLQVVDPLVDLANEDAAMLLARRYHEGFTGRLDFVRDEAKKTIAFEEGRPVFATSNLPHDRMGDLLYREGKITREQHSKSRDMLVETGRRMGEILVELGFLKPRELLPAVRRHVEDLVYSLFAWESGQCRLVPGDGAQGEKIRLAIHPTALLVEGIRRKMGVDLLERRLGGLGCVLAPSRGRLGAAELDADLSSLERRILDLFDGSRTLADVLAASAHDRLTVLQLAYAALALELLRSSQGEAGIEVLKRIRDPLELRIDRERILAKHSQIQDADYFAILGVRRDCTGFEVRRAHENARREYANEAFPVELQRELQAALVEIEDVLDEAYRVLRDDDMRGRYLRNVRG